MFIIKVKVFLDTNIIITLLILFISFLYSYLVKSNYNQIIIKFYYNFYLLYPYLVKSNYNQIIIKFYDNFYQNNVVNITKNYQEGNKNFINFY